MDEAKVTVLLEFSSPYLKAPNRGKPNIEAEL